MSAQLPNQDLIDLLQLVSIQSREARQVREIVSIEEWLENPFYCGEDGTGLFDFWKQEITNFWHSGQAEWILFGSLGGGKTTAGVFALMRKIYELSCYEPIPYRFGLMLSTVIYFVYFSVSLTAAKRTGYGKLLRAMDETPYFQKYFPRDKRVESSINLRNMSVVYGSSVTHQIGLDMLGCLLDEGDFYEVKGGSGGLEEFSVARDIYSSTINRRKLRFSIAGVDNGISVLVSSPAYGTDFVEKRIERAERTGEGYVTRTVGYEIQRDKHSPTVFYVFGGTEDVDPAILDGPDNLREITESLNITLPEDDWEQDFDELIDSAKEHDIEIFDVPDNLRESFEEDLLKAVRDVMGKSLRAVAAYMNDKSARACINYNRKHPFSKSVISLSTKSDQRIEDFLDVNLLGPKEVPRFIHIDQSITTDRTGIASSMLLEDAIDHPYPKIMVEFMLAISPPAVGEIPILRCAEFVTWLQEEGYEIGMVTMDSHQSRASLQHFRNAGLKADLLSVDRDDIAYIETRNLINNLKIEYYDYPLFIREIVNLVWDRRRHKIDHPPSSSKDVTDAVAASVHNALLIGPTYPSIRSLSVIPDAPEPPTREELILNDEYWDEY